MENASKALLIAGGILISMITISLFYFAFGRLSFVVGEAEENTTQKEIAIFNTSFEAYNKKVMYGVDIISILNKAIDNNKRHGVEYYNEPQDEKMLDYYVDVIFTYNTKNIDGSENGDFETYSLKNNYTKNANIIKTKFLDPVIKNEESIHRFKVAGFKCSNLIYNKKGETKDIAAIGRVKGIEFIGINN